MKPGELGKRKGLQKGGKEGNSSNTKKKEAEGKKRRRGSKH